MVSWRTYRDGSLFGSLRLFEIAGVFVRFDHVARVIVNANHRIVWTAVKLCVADCVTALILPFAYPGALR